MHMDSPAPEQIEGRLLALRKMLARLIHDHASEAWIARALPEDLPPQDGQEDPGAVPDPAFAIEFSLAEELRALGQEVRRLREG
jgi:hypothetical protein